MCITIETRKKKTKYALTVCEYDSAGLLLLKYLNCVFLIVSSDLEEILHRDSGC